MKNKKYKSKVGSEIKNKKKVKRKIFRIQAETEQIKTKEESVSRNKLQKKEFEWKQDRRKNKSNILKEIKNVLSLMDERFIFLV